MASLIELLSKIAQAQAAGDDTSDLEDKLSEEQTKLDTNISTDEKSAGATSQGVVSSSGSSSSADASDSTTSTSSTSADASSASASSTDSAADAAVTDAAQDDATSNSTQTVTQTADDFQELEYVLFDFYLHRQINMPSIVIRSSRSAMGSQEMQKQKLTLSSLVNTVLFVSQYS